MQQLIANELIDVLEDITTLLTKVCPKFEGANISWFTKIWLNHTLKVYQPVNELEYE